MSVDVPDGERLGAEKDELLLGRKQVEEV